MGFYEIVKKWGDISINEIKQIKKVFKEIDKMLRYSENMNTEQLDGKKSGDDNFNYALRMGNLKMPLWNLFAYEINYTTFEKYVSEEKYLSLIKEAYEVNERYLQDSPINSLRLRGRPQGSKREAKNELKDYVKLMKKGDPLVVKMLLSKHANAAHEEAVYSGRDWLINDFDALIDTIEPVRQEYIISRKGDVKPEEVDAMLLEKFPDDYEGYRRWVTVRPIMAFPYYPDLKI